MMAFDLGEKIVEWFCAALTWCNNLPTLQILFAGVKLPEY